MNMPLFHLGPLHYTEKRRTLNCNYGISIVGVLLTSHRIRQMFDLPFSCVQEATHIDRLTKHRRVDSFSQAFDEHVTRFRYLLLCNCVWQNAKTAFFFLFLSLTHHQHHRQVVVRAHYNVPEHIMPKITIICRPCKRSQQQRNTLEIINIW